MSLPDNAGALTAAHLPAVMHKPAMRWFLDKWQVGRQPLLIIGHGRSGTTWVGNVFATARRVLYCFEPGNPTVAKHVESDVWFRYLRPGQPDSLFEQLFDTAFRGLPYNRRWRRSAWHRFLPGYRMVVKDVASFMCLEWLAARYDPAVLIVIRHPCPTILSELKQGTDPHQSRQAILGQPGLWEGDLEPYRTVLESARSAFEILATIWASRLHILSAALKRNPQWNVARYEALCSDPTAQFRQLFAALDMRWTRRVEQFVRHSSTNHEPGQYSGVRLSAQQQNKWKQQLDSETIMAVRRQIELFDLPFYRSAADWPDGGEPGE